MFKKMKKTLTLFIVLVLFSVHDLIAQTTSDISNDNKDTTKYVMFKNPYSPPGNYPKKQTKFLEGLEVSGYYRFLTNFRKMDYAYPHMENNKTTIFVGDDTQIPQFMLNIKGHPSSNTEFGADLFMWTPLTGAGEVENVKGLNLGVNLYGAFSTDLGNFVVRTGGINWYALSPFTFQTNKGNNRYSLFERNPWDPSTLQIDTRYRDFYTVGEINQDQRWGNQAFQGLILEGNELPNDFSFNLMYGKTQFDGGLSPIPNTSFGGRIMKTYGNKRNFIAFNSFNNQSYVDSSEGNRVGFNISTIEITHNIDRLKLYAEIGGGRTFNEEVKDKWGEAISFKLFYDIARKFPTEFHLYRISPKVFNNTSVFINSNIQQNVQVNSNQTQPVLIPVSSAMLPMGQLSNNRQGIEINTQVNIGKFKNSIGYSNAMELDELSSKLTYTHAFNNLTLSRFWRFSYPSDVGPYNNLNKIYRSVFETLNLTELDPATNLPLSKKYFNTIELSSKYYTTLFNKELFLFYFGSFNSVQNFSSPFVVFSESALLRAYDHQFETYLKLNSKIVWCNYFGFERIIANYSTERDVITKRPKNQTGTSFGTGFDFSLSRGVGLYVRQRWMDYHDSSFEKDKYKGFETTVELTIFF
jgi:hypothetical protein